MAKNTKKQTATRRSPIAKGVAIVKTAINGLSGRVRSLKLGRVSLATLIDQLGQRLEVEETGVLLYDEVLGRRDVDAALAQKLRHIRDEEAKHVKLVRQALRELGGDPREKTPSADAAAVESSGLLKEIQRVDAPLTHILHTLLTAELTDNAGWELLSVIARSAGYPAYAARFERALLEEQEHLIVVRDALARAVKAADRAEAEAGAHA
jgi:rubrerythrin